MPGLKLTGLRAMRRRSGSSAAQLRRPIGLIVVLGTLLVWAGCSGEKDPATPGGSSSTAGTGPQISAAPNPVPAGPEKFGKTTISWNTGDGSVGEVYVSTNGSPEKLFAGKRSKGSLEATWIGKGVYEFRLYAGTDHQKVLSSLKVTRLKQ